MKRIAIYSRKSKFTGKGDSIGNQVEMCKNYINNLLRGVEIDVSVFEDEGFSGKNLERPDFKKMMEIHDIKPFDYIVVYRLDRISRNVGDCAKLMERLNTTHTAFISVSEPMYDTSKSSGVAMLNMSMVFAQLERDSIAERIKDNMYMQAKSGRWTGGTTPLGFKSIKHTSSDVNGKSRSYFTLETDDTKIDLVKLIFSKYSELQSINATENYLNQTNNLTRNGNKWNKANVKRILENPIYCTADKESLEYFTKLGCNVCFDENDCNDGFGILPYNRHSGQDRKSSAPENWVIAASSHLGIMSGAEWIRIQDILKQNSKNCYGGVSATKRSFNQKSILSGVLVCRCGSYMRPKIYGSGAMYYLCENKEQTKKVASNKSAENVLKELAKKDSTFASSLEKRLVDREKLYPAGKQQDVLRRGIKSLRNGKIDKNVYEALNLNLVDHNPEGQDITNKFYNALRSKGYDALGDINDKKYSGYNTKNPVIVINGIGKTSVLKARTVYSGEIDADAKKAMKMLTTDKAVSDAAKNGAIIAGAILGIKAITSYSSGKTNDKIVAEYKKEHPGTELSYNEIVRNYKK